MSLPFDATLKDLVRDYPRDFLATLDGSTAAAATPLNVDLSTITAATDTVLKVGDPPECVVHFDFQSGPAYTRLRRILLYNAALYAHTGLPVHSILVLLRRQADHSGLTGTIQYQPRPGRGKLDFLFEVIRLWDQPVAPFLEGGLGTVPLAPLCRLAEGVPLEEGMAQVVRRVIDRLQQGAPVADVRKLLTAAYLLTGLRVDQVTASRLFQGVGAMHESSTYQAILDEGEIVGIQKILLRQGRLRLGEPDDATKQAVMAINDLPRLERLSERLLQVNSWQELLWVP